MTELFQQMEINLSTTWDYYYKVAAAYFMARGNLCIYRCYVIEGGFGFGIWIQCQRKLYRSNDRQLSQGRIERLSSIGMVREDEQEFDWQEGYHHAQQFYGQNGHLNVKNAYVCQDGCALGAWIRRMRQQKNGTLKKTLLTLEPIVELDAIGMMRSVYSGRWHNG